MLSYYVLNDVILKLEDKYKEQFPSINRIFFSANLLRVFDYYNIQSFKKNNYNLSYLLKHESQKELFSFLIDTIKENDYNPEIILLLYGLIIEKSIKDITKPYFDSLCGVSQKHSVMRRKHKLERIISYKLRDEHFNVQLVKTKSLFYASTLETETISEIFNQIYKLSNTKKIFSKAQDDFYFYHNQNINFLFFKKIKYSLIDNYCTYNYSMRTCLRSNLINKKIDYLNISNNQWLNPYSNSIETTSFLELYDKIIKNALERIADVNDVIFYNKSLKKSIYSTKEFKIKNKDLENPIFNKLTKFKFKK